MSRYQSERSFADRKNQADQILERHPDRIPGKYFLEVLYNVSTS
jgi:hypothetical protein